jgi:hypothetical protein
MQVSFEEKKEELFERVYFLEHFFSPNRCLWKFCLYILSLLGEHTCMVYHGYTTRMFVSSS